MYKLLLNKDEVNRVSDLLKNEDTSITTKLKVYVIFAYPDTNEGRYGPQKQGYVVVNSNRSHDSMLIDFLTLTYGLSTCFCMGDYLAVRWRYEEVENMFNNRICQFLRNEKILAVIEPLHPYDAKKLIFGEFNHFIRNREDRMKFYQK